MMKNMLNVECIKYNKIGEKTLTKFTQRVIFTSRGGVVMKNENVSVGLYGYYSHVSAKMISYMTGLSSSDISNRKGRNPDFPIDRNTEKGTAIYYYGDVLKWAHAHNIPIYGKKTIYRDIEILERDSMNSVLNIGIVGRARGGKSFISSYFLDDTVFMRQGLCGGGTDYTQIPTKIIIDGSSPFFRFTVEGDELKDRIPDEIKGYVNRAVSIDVNAPDFQFAMERINDWLRSLHVIGVERLEEKVSLEIVTKPSELCKNIMERTGKQTVVIMDTPGVSGDYTFDSLGRQDVVIIAMRDENIDEFIKSIGKIAELVGTNTVIYSYRTNDNVTENDEYEDAQFSGRKSMKRFKNAIVSAFDNDCIISSSINALHPLDHFVALPIFKSKKYMEVEKMYENALENMIVDGVGSRITAGRLGEVLSKAGISKSDVLIFLKNVIYVPPIRQEGVDSRNAILNTFREAKHARVKSQDEYRILSVVNRISQESLAQNKKKLEQFNIKNCTEEWQQLIVQYVYQTIDRTIKAYPGVGTGTHQWEDSPAVTMRTCESVFAKELYNELEKYAMKTEYTSEEKIDITSKYRRVLQVNNIQSRSWDRVIANPYSISSLKILVDSGLLEGACDSEDDLIRNCAVNGLFFKSIVDIYIDVLRGIDAYEDMDQVISIVKDLFTQCERGI